MRENFLIFDIMDYIYNFYIIICNYSAKINVNLMNCVDFILLYIIE